MTAKSNVYNVAGWGFGLLILLIGILNIFLVHPVPGIAYVLISFIYYPPFNNMIGKNFGFSIPLFLKILLGVALIIFTLGVSDLGDMIDKL
ncbi:MAG TPA: hypothetical protein VF868_09120 [Bacteroidia bacterium]|jgi:hypothetical protein